MIGVHKDSTDAYKMLACSAAGEDCPGCAKTPDPYLRAYCDLDAAGGTCTAASAHELGVTRCENDSQCALRAGLGCCEACFGDPDALVAINPGLEPELRERVCQGEPLGCPECAVVYPPGAKAVCQGGLCAVSGL